MNRSRAARGAIGVLIAVIACVVVAQGADIPAALAGVVSVNVAWLAPLLAVVALQLAVRAVRWAGLLTAMGSARVRPKQTIGPLAAGYLGNTVLPARLGEVVRIVLISRRTDTSTTVASASVIVERGVDLLALLAVASAASALVTPAGWLPFAVVLGALLVAGLMLPSAGWFATHVPAGLPRRPKAVITNLFNALAAARPRVVAAAWILSLLAWGCDLLVVWLCALALGIPVEPAVAALIAVGAAAGAAVPGAAGYVGTYELGALTMAGVAGVPQDLALQIALLAHGIAVVPLAVAGFVSIIAMQALPVGAGSTGAGARSIVAHEPATAGRPTH